MSLAGIKLWVLTGDKQETAINIGQSFSFSGISQGADYQNKLCEHYGGCGRWGCESVLWLGQVCKIHFVY